jgi:predicted 2-oxoglutarate/Fe(II)-dependent dioxygenase YbiX
MDSTASTELPGAPVLLVPQLFEPEFCRLLIEEYERDGGTDSGFVRSDAQGRTVAVLDHAHKRRRDANITTAELRAGFKQRIERRLVPEVRSAFQFTATRIERYIVACYDAAEGGHFKPHRDNTTLGTAHRKFAVTLNLNADFDGGGLRFPEFGQRAYRAPAGSAIVFSCSLLHEATPVTSGRRYCTLPFLYDETGEQTRRENLRFVIT